MVEGEIEEKLIYFWDAFVRNFFVCPELELEAAEPCGEHLHSARVSALRAKPLLVVSPDASESQSTRDARPPDTSWSHPLSYAKTPSRVFIGNSHFYIFVRLYHVVLTRLAAAKEMATAEQEKLAAAADVGDCKTGTSHQLPAAQPNGLSAAGVEAEGSDIKSNDALSRMAMLTSLRRDSNGDLYAAFQAALKLLIDGKMEAATYEDGEFAAIMQNSLAHAAPSLTRAHATRNTQHATRNTQHGLQAPRTAHHAPRTTHRAPRTTLPTNHCRHHHDACLCSDVSLRWQCSGRSWVPMPTFSSPCIRSYPRLSSSYRCCWSRTHHRNC